jgi:hypothetical protein
MWPDPDRLGVSADASGAETSGPQCRRPINRSEAERGLSQLVAAKPHTKGPLPNSPVITGPVVSSRSRPPGRELMSFTQASPG